MTKKIGNQTIKFQNPPSILSSASVAGKKEGEGPLSAYFDKIMSDAEWGEDSWEKTESKMQKTALSRAVEKAKIDLSKLDYLLAGDLLNQCTSSTFAFRAFGVPFLGVYGACSTMAETLGLASTMIDGGFTTTAAAVTSSHFCTAERQYRFPLEYGGQRPPTAQWTVTGSGAIILSKSESSNAQPDNPSAAAPKHSAPNDSSKLDVKVSVTHFTVGKIVDAGIKDANNMGAAMAPAAAETLATHLKDTGRSPGYYDLILTGDLGKVGKSILIDLMQELNYDIRQNYNDCGLLVFDIDKQDMHAGGSGCGCGAITLCGYILDLFRAKKLKNLLFIGTGALLSPTSSMQGESIPSVAHAVALETDIR